MYGCRPKQIGKSLLERKREKDNWNWHGQWEGYMRTYKNRCIDEDNYRIAHGSYDGRPRSAVSSKQSQAKSTTKSELSASKHHQGMSSSKKVANDVPASPLKVNKGASAAKEATRSSKKAWTFDQVGVEPASPVTAKLTKPGRQQETTAQAATRGPPCSASRPQLKASTTHGKASYANMT